MAGYSFYGDVIYVIHISHKDALEIYREVRHHPCLFQFPQKENFPADPSAIYIRTEESWFGLRFHDFCKDHFMIHRMKPLYMDEDSLKDYKNIYHCAEMEILKKREM